LYLAIVVIWACVLIPRWLRRGLSHVSGPAIPDDVGDGVPGEDAATGRGGAEAAAAEAGAGAGAEPGAEADSPEQDSAPPPLTPEESRRRMLAARRRLLGMMIALEGAAIALAVFGLAALWVVIPPSVMLTGYLLLLREAAHADAERARREQEAALARDRARERARGRERAERGRGATAAPAASSAATAAQAAEYEDAGPGRDFAPGLAGKYTTSNAEVIPIPERAEEGFYDQYKQNKLRAVGD